MNKTAVKNFAIWARQKLISDITYKAGMLGITENGIAKPLDVSTNDLQFFDIGTKNYAEVSGNEIMQRKALVDILRRKEKTSKSYKDAFNYIVEEVAYTWFNRLIAIRFMEVNDYLPSGVRVLSSENSAKSEPDLVTTPFDTDLDFTPYEQDRVMQLKDENKLDELFRMLFIKQCNKLNEILPDLFEKTNHYTELLLNISFTDKDGIVSHLINDISEDDFNVEKEGQVEIIGWLYQYYNTVPKDMVFASLKKNIKITKENIPAATQLFTPDWIVRYMVENSLGRLWIDRLSARSNNGSADLENSNKLKAEWKYYLEEAEQSEDVKEKLNAIRSERSLEITNIRFLDPCMGSGHILVYAFDVFMQIYRQAGYTERDAVTSILTNNLFGIDIDKRAAQLAYFALMMKARQYDPRFFRRQVQPNVCYIRDTYNLSRFEYGADQIEIDDNYKDIANYLIDIFKDAKEYGSIIDVKKYDYDGLKQYIDSVKDDYKEDLFTYAWIDNLTRDEEDYGEFYRIIKQAQMLSQKYDVVCTNPPYMGSSGMNAKLGEYVKKNYPDSKSDLFAVFIEKCSDFAKANGYYSMITQHAWMFLSSYEKLRNKLQSNTTINMAHLGARAFDEIGGEVVQTTAFVNYNEHIDNYFGTYVRLVDINGENQKKELFLSGEKRFTTNSDNFSKIPGSPVAYWVSENFIKVFEHGIPIGRIGNARQGIIPGNVNVFVRFWYEPSFDKIGFNHKSYEDICRYKFKWFPYNKGGAFRRWYGNIEYLINMENNGHDIKYSGENNNYRLREPELYFKEAVTWSKISSGAFSSRYMPSGNLFDIAGCCVFELSDMLKYVLSFTNSKVSTQILDIISPTLNYEVDHIKRLPIIIPLEAYHEKIDFISEENINLSKTDWDAFETSWDFEMHPIVKKAISRSHWGDDGDTTIEYVYKFVAQEFEKRFEQLKANEEELNRIFIDIYGLQDELTPEVEDKDVTVRRADLQRDIKSLISYAVGCMFGRYSLDAMGLVYAGGEWEDSKYRTFMPDEDNCIPITDEAYFSDDIVGRFEEFIRVVFGNETLEENLRFIAGALGNRGNTSREVIRNYFLNDFIKDHIKLYQKRPIYWLYDSGKQNGFKALIYMHRYNADTTGNMRVEYLHRVQRVYEKELERMQEIIDNSANNREISAVTKRKEKLQKQLKETKEYDAKVAHLALSRIDIDLDDGVKVNYEKVQTAADGTKLQILSKM